MFPCSHVVRTFFRDQTYFTVRSPYIVRTSSKLPSLWLSRRIAQVTFLKQTSLEPGSLKYTYIKCWSSVFTFHCYGRPSTTIKTVSRQQPIPLAVLDVHSRRLLVVSTDESGITCQLSVACCAVLLRSCWNSQIICAIPKFHARPLSNFSCSFAISFSHQALTSEVTMEGHVLSFFSGTKDGLRLSIAARPMLPYTRKASLTATATGRP